MDQSPPPISELPQYPRYPQSQWNQWKQWSDHGYPQSPYDHHGYVPPGTNGMAKASFVLGILGFFGVTAVLSMVFGCISLPKTKRTGQRGRGFAIAGLSFSAAWLALFATIGVIGVVIAPHAVTRDASGKVTRAGIVALFDLKTGDCFADPNAASPGVARTVGDVTAMPCKAAHDAEVYGVQPWPGGSGAYPGFDQLQSSAKDLCGTAFKAYVYDRMSVPQGVWKAYYVPEAVAWAHGERRLLCAMESPSKLTRPLREDSSVLNPDQVRYAKAIRDFNDQVQLIDGTDRGAGLGTWQKLAADMASIASREDEDLSGTWPAGAQKAIDAMVAKQGKAIPLYELAAKAPDAPDTQVLLSQALAHVDIDDALAVRSALGLSTRQGQAPNTGADVLTV
jgi:hypothetical protein